MFSFSNKFNKASFGIDTKDYEYIKLAEVAKASSPDEIHPINGLYVHSSALGDSPVVIDIHAKKLVNMPKHMGETFREILADTEAVQAIKDGKVGYTIYTYESHAKTCYGINFVDIK
jgi:hypothetical protein